MATPLDVLIGKLGGDIAVITLSLRRGDITPDMWSAMFRTLLEKYHKAAFIMGGADLNNKAQQLIFLKALGAQYAYQNSFTQKVKDSGKWDPRWESRAVMYAESLKIPYWRAATGFASLPSLPGQGTACLTNCRCSWRSNEVGGGLVLWSWERFSGDSCHTCVERGLKWVNLPFLNGKPLQDGF